MEQSASQSRKAILIFLLITFGLSSIYYFLIIHAGKLAAGGGLYVTGLMWSPALAAFITSRILKRKIADLGWHWGNPKYQLWAYLVPIIYSLVAYLIIWITGWGGFYNLEFVKGITTLFGWEHLSHGTIIVLFFIISGILGMVGSLSRALGEEIGWRGFLVPELAKTTNYTKTSLISGIIWSLWHYPILIFADYNSGTPVWFGLSCFTVMVVSLSFIFTWFRLKSGSVWTAAILHATHNLYIQHFFTPITSNTGNTNYFVDEFGIVLPVVCLIAAIYFWTRRGELVNKPLTQTS
jgi:membrane protease YdiL (CAAX protease family)